MQVIDRTDLRCGDTLALSECDGSEPCELELRVQIDKDTFSGVLRGRPRFIAGSPIEYRDELHAVA